MTKFQAGTILTSQVMDCQVHAIEKAIRPFLQIRSQFCIILEACCDENYSISPFTSNTALKNRKHLRIYVQFLKHH